MPSWTFAGLLLFAAAALTSAYIFVYGIPPEVQRRLEQRRNQLRGRLQNRVAPAVNADASKASTSTGKEPLFQEYTTTAGSSKDKKSL